MTPAAAILQSARVAELKQAAQELATLCQARPVIAARKKRGTRCWLRLLAAERQRSAKLIEALKC